MTGREYITSTERVVLENKSVINLFSHVVPSADIGANCMIGEHCYIAGKIGENSRVQNGNNVWDGIEIGKNVFIGPNCHLTNDFDPSRRFERDTFTPDKIIIGDCTTIGTGVSIVAPCKIGRNARIGAGSVVLRDIKDYEQVNGVIK